MLQAEVIGFGATASGLRVRYPVLLVIAVASRALTLLGIGMALGVMPRSQSELNVAYDIGSLLLSAVGGALVPPAERTGWARAISSSSPACRAMGALRSAAGI